MTEHFKIKFRPTSFQSSRSSERGESTAGHGRCLPFHTLYNQCGTGNQGALPHRNHLAHLPEPQARQLREKKSALLLLFAPLAPPTPPPAKKRCVKICCFSVCLASHPWPPPHPPPVKSDLHFSFTLKKNTTRIVSLRNLSRPPLSSVK